MFWLFLMFNIFDTPPPVMLSTKNDQKETFNVWLHDDESELVVIQGRENQFKSC